VQDYSRKGGVVFTTVLTPDGAPEWMREPERLWNAVEFKEDESNRHASAQLARNLDFSLPVELTQDVNRELALAIGEEFRSRGMVAQVSIHEPEPEDRQPRNPHAHILLTMRDVTPEGFGKKNREWNGGWMKEGTPDGGVLKGWRTMIADHTNAALESAGCDARVDARSYKDQGLDQVPTVHLGKEATALRRRGIDTRQGAKQKIAAVRNAALRSNAVAEDDGEGERKRRDTYDNTFDARREDAARPAPKEHARPPAEKSTWLQREDNRQQGRKKELEPEL